MLKSILKYKMLTSLFPGMLVLIHVAWEYFHGGVTRHNLLAREDLPSISNWWGLLSIPLLTWITLSIITVRLNKTGNPYGNTEKSILKFFAGGLVFGLVLAGLWELGKAEYMPYMLLIPLVLALFIPTYRPECLLGFVLGMAFTFGGVLPIGIGLVLLMLCFIIYKGIRGGILALLRRIG